jgi:FkbM family methyltransferase
MATMLETYRDIRGCLRAGGIRGLAAAALGGVERTPLLLRVKAPGLDFPVHLRMPSTDVRVFEDIFIHDEYAVEATCAPRFIVDIGANIGLASIYFAAKFPTAQIFAVEPAPSNIDVLKKNIAPFENIVLVPRAIWHENTSIDLVDPGLGNWGFTTRSHAANGTNGVKRVHEVEAWTVDTLMRTYGIDNIDILKIDIEGAEVEVFRDPSAWIAKVDALIVELHERIKPGCNRSFYSHSDGFDDEWSQGEKVFLTRRRGCILRSVS